MRNFQSKIWQTGLKLAILAPFCLSFANADQILYWQDDIQGTSAIPGAITQAGFTGVAATSAADFDSQLTSQAWAAVIISIANDPLTFYDSINSLNIENDLTSYVTHGGVLIGHDYDIAAGGDSALETLFQAHDAESFNATTITNDGSPLFTGITGDISVLNTFWTIYNVELIPTGTAVAYGPSDLGYGIVEGTTGSGTTFLNGVLPDSYANLIQGEQLIANEISFSTGSVPPPPSVPEPGTVFLVASGLAAVAVFRYTRRHSLYS